MNHLAANPSVSLINKSDRNQKSVAPPENSCSYSTRYRNKPYLYVKNYVNHKSTLITKNIKLLNEKLSKFENRGIVKQQEVAHLDAAGKNKSVTQYINDEVMQLHQELKAERKKKMIISKDVNEFLYGVGTEIIQSICDCTNWEDVKLVGMKHVNAQKLDSIFETMITSSQYFNDYKNKQGVLIGLWELHNRDDLYKKFMKFVHAEYEEMAKEDPQYMKCKTKLDQLVARLSEKPENQNELIAEKKLVQKELHNYKKDVLLNITRLKKDAIYKEFGESDSA